MIRKRNFGLIAASILVALAAAPLHAQDVTQLQNDLNAKYKSGTILVIQKNGITGQAPNNLAPPCGSTWKDNALHPGNTMCLMVQKNYSKALTKDEKVNPTSVVIHLKDEKVIVNFTECDSCNGGDASSYKGTVAFQFPKGYLEGGADAGQVADVISQVLAPPDPNADQGTAATTRRRSATTAASPATTSARATRRPASQHPAGPNNRPSHRQLRPPRKNRQPRHQADLRLQRSKSHLRQRQSHRRPIVAAV